MWWLLASVLCPAPATSAPPDADVELALRATRHLSALHASEEERDLLRREYRLVQAATDFWRRFDGLSEQIRSTERMVQALGAQLAFVPVQRVSGLEALSLNPLQQPEHGAAPDQPQEHVSRLPLLLAGGAALLALAAWVRRRRRQLSRQPQVVPAALAAPAAESVVTSAHPVAAMPVPEAMATAVQDMGGGGSAVVQEARPPQAAARKRLEARREELDHALDLANAMLSVGGTAAALQTLKEYLNANPTRSIRPWLKLLETYRHTGARAEFEREAELVHRHFNVRVPSWDEGVAGEPLLSFFEEDAGEASPSLEDIPHLAAQIQASWGTGACQAYLRHLLADNRGGERMGFPVSIVAEILMLEDILNDLLAGE